MKVLNLISFGFLILIIGGIICVILLFDASDFMYEEPTINYIYSAPDLTPIKTVHQAHIRAMEAGNYVEVRILPAKVKTVYQTVVKQVEVPVYVQTHTYETQVIHEYEDWSRQQALDRLASLSKDRGEQIEDSIKIEVN